VVRNRETRDDDHKSEQSSGGVLTISVVLCLLRPSIRVTRHAYLTEFRLAILAARKPSFSTDEVSREKGIIPSYFQPTR